MIIYLVLSSISKKKYVGQTIQSIQARWSGHLADTKSGSSLPLHNAIRKYGNENFVIKQIAKIQGKTTAEELEWLNILEPLFINAHNSLVPYGYNLDGGGKNRGKRHPDTRIRMSAAQSGNVKGKGNIGKHHSEATKAKISLANKGRRVSLQTRAKISNYLKGNQRSLGLKRSEETRLKMSLALKNPSAETRAKIAAASALRRHSEESKAKIAISKIGKPRSAETKNAISSAKKGKPWTKARREAQTKFDSI